MKALDIAAPWIALDAALGVSRPVVDEAHCRRLEAFAEELAESLPDEADHAGWGLVRLVAERIREFEERHHPQPGATQGQVLRALMREHGLSQSDLPEIGSQSVVSELLSAKRTLNLRQVKALALRFRVPIEVLLP